MDLKYLRIESGNYRPHRRPVEIEKADLAMRLNQRKLETGL